MGYVLDTAELAADLRVEAVNTAMMYASAPAHVLHEGPAGGVHARLEVWDFGDANIFTHRSSGIRLLRTAKLARQGSMPVVALAVQERADGRIEHGGQQRVVRPGELLAVDLSAPYDYSWSGDGGAGALQIPYDQLGLPLDVVRRGDGRADREPALPAGHRARRAAGPRSGRDHRGPGVGGGRGGQRRAGAGPVRVGRPIASARAAGVRRDAADPGAHLHPAAPGRSGAHPGDDRGRARHLAAAAYKLCADAGLSLEQWIINERLHRVRHELTRPDRRHLPIATIALRWGFRDPTHFTRRFKARYGTTPSQWRRSAQ